MRAQRSALLTMQAMGGAGEIHNHVPGHRHDVEAALRGRSLPWAEPRTTSKLIPAQAPALIAACVTVAPFGGLFCDTLPSTGKTSA